MRSPQPLALPTAAPSPALKIAQSPAAEVPPEYYRGRDGKVYDLETNRPINRPTAAIGTRIAPTTAFRSLAAEGGGMSPLEVLAMQSSRYAYGGEVNFPGQPWAPRQIEGNDVDSFIQKAGELMAKVAPEETPEDVAKKDYDRLNNSSPNAMAASGMNSFIKSYG